MVHLLALLLVAISMAAGWAHLLALPNKIGMSRADYFVVQQIYRGWALLGIVVVGALGLTALLAWLERGNAARFRLALFSAACMALSLANFFAFTQPANRATDNWTMIPEGWDALRRQWEYSHAASAMLYAAALASLAISAIWQAPMAAGSRARGRTGTVDAAES